MIVSYILAVVASGNSCIALRGSGSEFAYEPCGNDMRYLCQSGGGELNGVIQDSVHLSYAKIGNCGIVNMCLHQAPRALPLIAYEHGQFEIFQHNALHFIT